MVAQFGQRTPLSGRYEQDVFDEYPAEGILDLRWSLDGSKAYAITNEGLAYIYEPELL